MTNTVRFANSLGLAGAALDYYHTNGLYESQQNADGSVAVVQTKLRISGQADHHACRIAITIPG